MTGSPFEKYVIFAHLIPIFNISLQHVSTTGHNTIGVKFQDKPWEQIGNIAVDKEGQNTYILRPRLDKVLHRMLCDIVVENNVKIVTLRSTYNVFNDCLYPMELILVDANNKPAQPVQKIGMSSRCYFRLSHSVL